MSPLVQTMYANRGRGILKKSALTLPGGDLGLERAFKDKGFDTVLEIGTFRGCTAAYIAQFCRRVVTIDLRDGQLERLGIPFDRYRFWKELGINNVELKLVENDEEKAKFIDALQFDAAFLDGGHDADSIKKDFEMVKRCGNVLFHDYNLPDHPQFFNRRFEHDFISLLPRDEVTTFNGAFALWTRKDQ